MTSAMELKPEEADSPSRSTRENVRPRARSATPGSGRRGEAGFSTLETEPNGMGSGGRYHPSRAGHRVGIVAGSVFLSTRWVSALTVSGGKSIPQAVSSRPGTP